MCERFREAHALCFGFGASHRCRLVFRKRTLRALLRFRNVMAQSCEIGLADGQFQSESRQFALRVLMLVGGAKHLALRFMLRGGHSFKRRFCIANFLRGPLHFRLHFARAQFKRCNFRVQCAQFAFHAQRSRFVGPAAGNHASLIAGAIGCDECVLRIFPSKLFGSDRAVGKVCPTQSGQELFRRRAERIAKFNQLIQARINAILSAERNDRFVLVNL